MSTKPVNLDIAGHEDWREYEFDGLRSRVTYRIERATNLQYRTGGTSHRVTDENGIVHILPAPGYCGCVVRVRTAGTEQPGLPVNNGDTD